MQLTENRTYATDVTVGRKKVYPVRITLPLSKEMADKLDSVRKKEPRVDVIRTAIDRELKRREREK